MASRCGHRSTRVSSDIVGLHSPADRRAGSESVWRKVATSRSCGAQGGLIAARIRFSLLALSLCMLSVGCKVLDEQASAAAGTPGLAWLTAFNSNAEQNPNFDLSLLKPTPSPGYLEPGELIELTVWDLYEPGKPHTFPVRLTEQRTLELPLVGVITVPRGTTTDLERQLTAEYQSRQFLKQPRIIARSLASTTIEVRVEGAVVAAGPVQLPRESARIFHALANAGGLRSTAGRQIGITSAHAVGTTAPETAAPAMQSEQPTGSTRLGTEGTFAAAEKSAPDGTSQSDSSAASDQSVSAHRELRGQTPEHDSTAADAASVSLNRSPLATGPEPMREAATAPSANQMAATVNRQTRWFDLQNERDLVALRELPLESGDVIYVSTATLPVRIAGAVAKPGSQRLPVAGQLNVWQTLELAGGIKTTTWPVVVTLYRPPGESPLPQRWSWTLNRESDEQPQTPLVQAGDVVHVGRPPGTRIRHAVDGLWKF